MNVCDKRVWVRVCLRSFPCGFLSDCAYGLDVCAEVGNSVCVRCVHLSESMCVCLCVFDSASVCASVRVIASACVPVYWGASPRLCE